MKNERGITLVELLAALAIIGIITTLIMSVFLNGSNASNRTATKQQLQQEANYIVEKIRSEYLLNTDDEIKMTILRKNEVQFLQMNDQTISEGFKYSNLTPKLDREKPSEFTLTIKDGSLSFKINTTLSKLN